MSREPRVSYVICTNPRSGSWLLSEGLERTQIAGRPREWFHEATEQEVCTTAGLPSPAVHGYRSFVEQIKQVGQTTNGVFGLKLHYYQFEELLSTKLRSFADGTDLPPSRVLEAAFPRVRYIWLTRRDKARQAVSYHRACQTDGWWQKDGQEPPRRPGTVAAATFDARAIEQLEALLVANERNWQRYFEETRADPFVLAYEDLAADYEGSIRRVLRWLGIPSADAVEIAPPILKKQADATTEEWVDRYLRLKRGPASPATAVSAAPPAFPHQWKRWIAENKLLKTSDDVIVDVLTNKGFAREQAAAEVGRAGGSPYLEAGDWYVQRLKKAYSLLAVYRELASLRPRDSAEPMVARRPRISRREFLENYYIASRPVVFEGLMNDWPAIERWTPEYLKALLADEEVEIMAGRASDPNYEVNCQQHRRKVLFGQYVDMVHSGVQTNDFYLVANNGFLRRPKPKQLLADIVLFEEYLDRRLTDGGVFFWYGPAGTVTPLHHDTSNIFMAQVRGRKRIKLISPADLEFLYNDIGVFSPIDCDAPDLSRWPLFAKAEVHEVVLEPGEVLFIPVGWWHHVRALDVSITVSFTNFAFPNHYEWSMPQIRK